MEKHMSCAKNIHAVSESFAQSLRGQSAIDGISIWWLRDCEGENKRNFGMWKEEILFNMEDYWYESCEPVLLLCEVVRDWYWWVIHEKLR